MATQVITFRYHYDPNATVEEQEKGVTLAPAGHEGSKVKVSEVIELYGKIKEITIHMPGGCNGLVGVAIWKGTKRIVPREGYIALDNVTQTFYTDIAVSEGEELTLEAFNLDRLNPHFINVTVTIIGEYEAPKPPEYVPIGGVVIE